MISKLLPVALLLLASSTLTSCLSGSNRPVARTDDRYDEATIWNRSSRYGAYQQQYYPRADPYNSFSPDDGFSSYTGMDRYQRYDPDAASYPPGQRRLSDNSMYYRDRTALSQPANPETGYNSGGFIPTSPRSATMRGGFEGPPAPNIEKKEERRESASTESAPPKKNNFDSLPYAKPVPGRKGFVTLGGANSNLPEIDVTGIPPGTPVEIPDPNNPGKTIQFRVP